MNYTRLNLIYFSATSTTKRIVECIARGIGVLDVRKYDITCGWTDPVHFSPEECVVMGVPVYAGRIPPVAVEFLKRFTGEDTPVILVCVYGNRDFDDALLELKNLAETNGFRPVSAAAFIGQHSIFPAVGKGRPDEEDERTAVDFGRESMRVLESALLQPVFPLVSVKGSFPYKPVKAVPLTPRTRRTCNACGVCVSLCPSGAIDRKNPRKTDKVRCMACGRCIFVCPRHARHFGGILYRVIAWKFGQKFTARKQPYLVYCL